MFLKVLISIEKTFYYFTLSHYSLTIVSIQLPNTHVKKNIIQLEINCYPADLKCLVK